MSEVDPHWYESFFESGDWIELVTTRDPEGTELEVSFLAERIPAGSRVLDLACGTGRVAIPLARRGYTVAGLDISQRSLDVARRDGPELDLRHGDMRELPWDDASFDAVVNIWTAFGYFPTQAEDERALAEVVRVLEPGGIFVLDTVNQAALLRRFEPRSWSELGSGTVLLERRDYDVLTGRVQAHWSFVDARGRRELSFDHRVYTIAEYGELLARAGLRVVDVFGDFDGVPASVDTWRALIVSQRDAA